MIPIKISLLLPSLEVGGAESLVLAELSHLHKDPRFQIDVHLVFQEGARASKLQDLNVPYRVWHAPHKSVKMLSVYFDIASHLRNSGCQILHCHLLNNISFLVGWAARCKVVTTVHSDTTYNWLERFSLQRNDLVIGCGKRVVTNIQSFVPADKVQLLKNAVPVPLRTSQTRENILRNLQVSSDSQIVLSLGRLSPEKGYDILINAFSAVVRQKPNAVLLIGGDGKERAKLEQMVAAGNLQKKVLLLGTVDNGNELLEVADIYVNSSRREGLPMTLLEAIVQAKPIVATNVGGNPEAVLHGFNGLLVPPENPDTLAEALVSLLTDKYLTKKLGQGALALAEESYSLDLHCEALADHYLKLNGEQ